MAVIEVGTVVSIFPMPTTCIGDRESRFHIKLLTSLMNGPNKGKPGRKHLKIANSLLDVFSHVVDIALNL